jgi:hypothetical protein
MKTVLFIIKFVSCLFCLLIKAQLQLKPPNILFSPSLSSTEQGGFYDLIEELLGNVYEQSSLIPRIAKHLDQPHYQVKNFFLDH